MEKFKRCTYLFLLLFILFGGLSGCGNKSYSVKLIDMIDQIQGMENYVLSGTLQKIYSENVIYEITDISWDGETGVAEVEVTTPDLSQIISDCIQTAIDECGIENYNALLEKVKDNIQMILCSEDCPMLEYTVEMEVEKTEDGYTLISNEDFEKIISGNLEEIFIQTLMEGFTNENSN